MILNHIAETLILNEQIVPSETSVSTLESHVALIF